MNEQLSCKVKSAAVVVVDNHLPLAAAASLKRKMEENSSSRSSSMMTTRMFQSSGVETSTACNIVAAAVALESNDKTCEQEVLDDKNDVDDDGDDDDDDDDDYDEEEEDKCRLSMNKEIEHVSTLFFDSNGTQASKHALCEVCGDKASGKHYGVSSCEGCKGFFRRTIEKAHSQDEARNLLQCKRGRNCGALNPSLRNSCGPCRLIACYMAGMNRTSSKLGRRPKNRKEEPVIRPAIFVEDVCIQFVQRMYTIFRDETRKSAAIFNNEECGRKSSMVSQTVVAQPYLLDHPLLEHSQYSVAAAPLFVKKQLCDSAAAAAVLSMADPIDTSRMMLINHLPAEFHANLSIDATQGFLRPNLISEHVPPFDPTQLVYLAQQDNHRTLLTMSERSQEPASLVNAIITELLGAQGSTLRKFAASRLHSAFILYARNVLSVCRSDGCMISNERYVKFMHLAHYTRQLLALPESALGLKTKKRLANQFQCRLLRQVDHAARLNLPFVELDVDLVRLGTTVYKVIESYHNAQMWLLNSKRRRVIVEQLASPNNRVGGERAMHLFLNHLTQISMRAIRFFMWFGTGNVNLQTRMAMIQQGVMGIAALALVPLFDLERGLLYSPSLCYAIPLDELDHVPLFGPFLQCHARLARKFHAQNISCEEWALLSAIYFTRPIVLPNQTGGGSASPAAATVRLHSLNAHFIKAFVFHALVRHTFGFWPDALPCVDSPVWSHLIRLWRLLSDQQRVDLKLEARNRFIRLTNPLNSFQELEELHKTLLGPIMSGAGSKLHSEIHSHMKSLFINEQQQQAA